MSTNPRYKNGHLRRKYRQRFKNLQLPCGICGKPIDYDAPSNSNYPNSFVIDEIIPVSRWEAAGFSSPEAAAQCFENLQPAHYRCNQIKGNKVFFTLKDAPPKKQEEKEYKVIKVDGDW